MERHHSSTGGREKERETEYHEFRNSLFLDNLVGLTLVVEVYPVGKALSLRVKVTIVVPRLNELDQYFSGFGLRKKVVNFCYQQYTEIFLFFYVEIILF